MLLVVKKGHIEEARYLCVKRTKMYSSEELEKFYFDYQTEWMPRGMSIQAYCSRNNVPYKLLDRWIKGIYKRVVPVEVTGIPEGQKDESPQQSEPGRTSSKVVAASISSNRLLNNLARTGPNFLMARFLSFAIFNNLLLLNVISKS